MSKPWREADHPRDRLGRFTEKPDGSFAATMVALALVVGAVFTIGWAAESGRLPSLDQADEPSEWSKSGLTFVFREQDQPVTCGWANSYGDVQEFFRNNPCDELTRTLFSVTDPDGNKMVVATATVTMPTAWHAREFRQLVDTPGTGNVEELGNTGYTAHHYDSRIDGATVVVAQAEPYQSNATDKMLDRAATVALDAPHHN